LEIRQIPAITDGQVERRLVLPGTTVEAGTVILELSNPQVEQEALDAEWQLKASEADYENLRVQLESQLFNQRASAAAAESAHKEAQLQAERNRELAKSGLAADIDVKIALTRAESAATSYEMEQKRLAIASQAVQAQLAAQRARVEQFRALHELRQKQMAALRVRPGIKGVLQRLPVDVGQRVTPGTLLAQVAVPDRLKAELRIPATQARDIQLGQKAEVDTRNGIIPGHVTRMDPAVQDGTVTVDVGLDGSLPRGARPDLNVDGTIELERLENVLYVGRPAFGQEQSLVGLFKITEGNNGAARVQVKLGRSSVNLIEIEGGLQEGDRVILSDMSAWDAHDRIRLN
jgi:HlyD family secretion protein